MKRTKLLAAMLVLAPAVALAATSGRNDTVITPDPLIETQASAKTLPTEGFKLGFDKAHSSVGFSVKHMVVATVKGKFNEWEGSVWFDPENPAKSTIDVTIDVASIDTESERRDNHLRSPEFFDAETYPHITFKSKRIEKREEGWVAVGELTIRDVTKLIEMSFELLGPVQNRGQDHYGADARLEINRQDWGVKWNQTMDAGGLVVSNKVIIEIHVELFTE